MKNLGSAWHGLVYGHQESCVKNTLWVLKQQKLPSKLQIHLNHICQMNHGPHSHIQRMKTAYYLLQDQTLKNMQKKCVINSSLVKSTFQNGTNMSTRLKAWD